jgi:hypothetical protein
MYARIVCGMIFFIVFYQLGGLWMQHYQEVRAFILSPVGIILNIALISYMIYQLIKIRNQ